MAKLTTVRQPLHFLATAGEGILYLLCTLFGYKEPGERGSPLPMSAVGVLPPCQQPAVAEGERSLCQQQPSWGTKVRGEPSHLPGGSAGRRGARLPQAADASADELVVFLRRGPRKASVGFILSGRLLSCRTNKAGLKEGCSLRGGSLQ